jgi:hypothetical protein
MAAKTSSVEAIAVRVNGKLQSLIDDSKAILSLENEKSLSTNKFLVVAIARELKVRFELSQIPDDVINGIREFDDFLRIAKITDEELALQEAEKLPEVDFDPEDTNCRTISVKISPSLKQAVQMARQWIYLTSKVQLCDGDFVVVAAKNFIKALVHKGKFKDYESVMNTQTAMVSSREKQLA